MIADFAASLESEDPNAQSVEAALDTKLGLVKGSPIAKDLKKASAQPSATASTPSESPEAEAASAAADPDPSEPPPTGENEAANDDAVSDSGGFDPADFGLSDDDME